MQRYWTVSGLLIVILLAIVLLLEALRLPVLADPSPWLERGGAVAAGVGVALLVADVALPVPSSAVMIANGALFGIAVGTALSLLGSMGAALLAFAIGRRGGPLLARLVPAEERAHADWLVGRWGALAIVVTRPVPILAETVAILAGASALGWRRAASAAIGGSLPAAVLYAVTGATATGTEQGVLTFVLVLLVAGLFLIVGCWAESQRARTAPAR
jgi:uncharacterized membrane protein YdjX (TVP38/TMEM64 family)